MKSANRVHAERSGRRADVLLSVVIPAFNVDEFISRTLESVMLQVPAVEVIVVDDGSTDDTLRVVEDTLSAWNGSSRVITQPNAGVSVARNVGLRHARGEYVLFLDGDDYVSPGLTSHLERALRMSPDIVCWGWDVVTPGDPDSSSEAYIPRAPELMSGLDALRAVITTSALPIWTASMALRRDFLRNQELLFTPGCHRAEDREFQYKALSSAESVTLIPTVLAHYLARPGSLSKRIDVSTLGAFWARSRAAHYVEFVQPYDGREIADHIRLAAATNYIRDVRHYVRDTGLRRAEAMRQIEDAHPGIDSEVRVILRRAVRLRSSLPLSMALYGLSPTTYWALVNVWLSLTRQVRRSKKKVDAPISNTPSTSL